MHINSRNASQTSTSKEAMNDREDFLHPRNRYYGEFTPENLAFNANLQEFAQKITYICSLETGGKISAEKAYKDIKALWKNLKSSKKNLGIGQKPPSSDQENSPQ